MITEEAKKRAKILTFWSRYGTAATTEAYGVRRATLFLWKKRLKATAGKLEGLNPGSRAPHKKRIRSVTTETVDFIQKTRLAHPRFSKEKLAVLLGNTISASTAGRIVHDLKEKRLIPSGKKYSFHAKTGRLNDKTRILRKKVRRKGYMPQEPGDLIQTDTVVYFIYGIRRYIVTAIDLVSDFAFAYAYTAPSSKSTTDFFQKLQSVAPFAISRVQTDNGSEFESHFREYLIKKKITHFHNYPRSPKMNAYVERFNRTIQEEFANTKTHLLADDLGAFNRALMDYLIWYNTERPHFGIKLKSPMQYIISKMTARKSNMLWTNTCS
jgi:transposase InsO family protein